MSLTLLLKILNDRLSSKTDPRGEYLDPITRIIDEGVSKHIQSQIPDFIISEHPKFVAFIEAYYEWLERKQNAYAKTHTLYEIGDIDRTMDEFVQYFSDTFLKNFPTQLAQNSLTGNAVDRRKLIKNIRSFYRAKGTERSFELLFRILYDLPVEFYYPKDDMFRVSDGVWKEPKSIKVSRENNSNDVLHTLENQQIFQYDETGAVNASAFVDSVLIYDDGPYKVAELFLRDITGDFRPDRNIESIVNNVTIIERIWSQIIGVSIVDGGGGFRINDRITINDPYGNGTNGLLLVNSVSPTGTIESLSIINSGTNITTEPTSIDVANSRQVIRSFVANLNDGSFQNSNFIERVNYPSSTTQNPNTRSFANQNAQISINPIGEQTPFNVTIIFGALVEYPGYYAGNNGKLSSNKFIQDSYYFQDFSYVLENEISANEWISTIKKLIHPAGHEVFGKVLFTRTNLAGLQYPSYHSEMRHFEIPLVGHYTPYKFATTEDLRNNVSTTDLYPSGFNPSSTGGVLSPSNTISGITGGRLELSNSSMGGFTVGSFTPGSTIGSTPSGATGWVAEWYLIESGLSGGTAPNGVLFLQGVTGSFIEGMTVGTNAITGQLLTTASSSPIRKGNGTVFPENGSFVHDTLSSPLGSLGNEGYTSANDLNLPFWNIYHHPNAKGWAKIPSGIPFSGVTIDHFLEMDQCPVFHSNPGIESWYTTGTTLEYNCPDGLTSGSINNNA